MDIVPELEAAKMAGFAGNNVRAEALYEKIVDKESKCSIASIAKAAFELSKLVEKRDHFGQALGLVKKAIILDPTIEYETAAFRLEKRVVQAKKTLDAEIVKFKRLLKTNESDPDKKVQTHLEFAAAYFKGDALNQAIEQYHEARIELEALLSESEVNSEGQAPLGDEAIEDIRGRLAAVLCEIGKCHDEMKEHDQAMDHYQLALGQQNANQPDTSIMKLFAWSLYRKKDFEGARGEFKKISSINFSIRGSRYTQEDIEISKNIAWCSLELGNRSIAKKEFEKIIEMHKKVYKKKGRLDIVNAYMLLGWFYYDYGRYAKKAAFFDIAVKKFSEAMKIQKKALGETDKKVEEINSWIECLPDEKKKNRKSLMMKVFDYG